MTIERTTRRGAIRVLASAVALGTTPAIATTVNVALPISPDADLVALGERFEKLIIEYTDASVEWGPLAIAARAEIDEKFGDVWLQPWNKGNKRAKRMHNQILRTNGADAASNRMAALWERMEPLAEAIKDAPIASLGGLRAKALVLLLEVQPGFADHEGLEFPDDGGATRSLFDAVAEVTGLAPIAREIEARYAAAAVLD